MRTNNKKQGNSYKDFSTCLGNYFSRYLCIERGLSYHTVASYSKNFTLLLTFLSEVKGVNITRLSFSDISKKTILDYLDWLERERNCATRSRNQRLSAIKSFYSYMIYEDPTHIAEWKQILSIPQRKEEKKIVQFLSTEEIEWLLNEISSNSIRGRRELTLLSLLYNTGMRVSELTHLRVSNLRFTDTTVVEIHGKGNKRRLVPLGQEMSSLMKQYLDEHHLLENGKDMHLLFYNARGEMLSSEGVNYILNKYVKMAKQDHPHSYREKVTPHVLRHSRAVHWLKAGIDIVYLRDLMGHVSIQTTEIYAKVDSKAKRDAVMNAWNCIGIVEPEKNGWEDKPKLLSFLEQFSKKGQQ